MLDTIEQFRPLALLECMDELTLVFEHELTSVLSGKFA